MKKIVTLITAASLLLSLAACGGTTASNGSGQSGSNNGDVITLRMGHAASAEQAMGMTCHKFAELVEEYTNGRYAITVYDAGQLGSEEDMINDLSMNTLDLALTNSAIPATLSACEDWAVTLAPYLITSYEQADAIYFSQDSTVSKDLLAELDGANIKGLSFVEAGFRCISSNTPINSIDDMAGLTIRIMTNDVCDATMRALGVNPTQMSWSEALTGIQQGAVDGQDNPVHMAYYMSVGDVNDYIALTNHQYNLSVLMMSGDLWKSLSAEDQELFQKAADDAAAYEVDLARERNATIQDEWTAEGIEFTEPDLAPFIEATQSVRDDLAAKYPEMYQKLADAVAEVG
jgi:tripartite ATP-independent transporter DctP family solute receptor